VESSVAAEAQKTARTNAAPAKAPDNTAHNKADAQPDTLTPMDQGNSDLDLHITQNLRRSIVSGKDGRHFSFAAKNIKIITVNGDVTLRGVVANDAERTTIESLAQQLAGVKKVNNQLGVKRAAR
jgi:hyperosmotically inducible protein